VEIHSVIGLALLVMLASTVMGTLIVWSGFFHTHVLVLPYLLVFFVFTQSTIGVIGVQQTSFSVYDRGAGLLFFSWLIWVLWILSGISLIRDKLLRIPTVDCSVRPWFVALLLLFLAHTCVGLALGISAKNSMSAQGLINIVNMGLLTLLMLRTVHSRKTLELLIWSGLIVIAARDLFGMGRFLFFGGDPANPYDNAYYALGAKLTFFDINDSLLACIAAAYCGFRLLHDHYSLSRAQKWFFASLTLLAVATIVFSLRRTAWGGLALVGALIVLLAPAGKRLALSIPIGVVLVAGLGVLFSQRLSVAWERAQVGWGALYYDLVGGAHYGQASLRALELQLAWQAYLDSPIFGQGPWGKFAAYSGFGETWHGGEGAFGFVHSGVLHILFKSGLVGFALFCGLLFSFLMFVKRTYPVLEPRYRAVLVMGAAGLLFMVPDFLFGTPVIELRTTQLMGLCFALPYLAYKIKQSAESKAS